MAANQPTTLRTEVDLGILSAPETLEVFEHAAEQFVKHNNDMSVEIWAASRDWFMEEWGRDTFISLPGLLLARKKYDDAKQIFSRFSGREHDGLIPNVIKQDETIYNTADASLLLIHALKEYVIATDDWPFVDQLMPTIRNVIAGYMHGTAYRRGETEHEIKMDFQDGLIISPAQATWMDADPSGNGSAIVTPRNGKCVEINALWYESLRFIIAAARKLDQDADTTEWEKTANLVHESYAAKFWNPDENCLYDVIEGDIHGGAVRPNQLFAISHGSDLLSLEQQLGVIAAVQKDLLTPGGLRTLSPRDSNYRGHYDTFAPMPEKDPSYHQGTIWPWLIGLYADSLRIVKREQGVAEAEIYQELKSVIAPLVQFCLDSEFKSLPEVFSGDSPFEPGGTKSQAWSVAEVLRILKIVNPTFVA